MCSTSCKRSWYTRIASLALADLGVVGAITVDLPQLPFLGLGTEQFGLNRLSLRRQGVGHHRQGRRPRTALLARDGHRGLKERPEHARARFGDRFQPVLQIDATEPRIGQGIAQTGQPRPLLLDRVSALSDQRAGPPQIQVLVVQGFQFLAQLDFVLSHKTQGFHLRTLLPFA